MTKNKMKWCLTRVLPPKLIVKLMMIKPYYETELGKLYHGDCLEIMPKLEPVDLVLTDPPYGLNKKIHNGGTWSTAKKYDAVLEWDFVPNKRVFKVIFNISKNQIIFGGNYFTSFLPVSRCWIIWVKPHFPTMSEIDMVWTSFNKPSKPIYFKRQNPSIHPTQKPIGLIIQILSKYAKDEWTILDPFLGSGTTAVACERTNRRWIGIEIEEKYCEIAAKRIEQEVRRPSIKKLERNKNKIKQLKLSDLKK